jgi:peroxiredoxin
MLKPEIAEKLDRNIEELRAHGMKRVLTRSAVAPAFALPDQTGRLVRSQTLLARGPLVVSFYRGTWCPYCNAEIAALNATYERFRAAGAEVVAISPQSAASAQPYLAEHPSAFPILVDADARVAELFGLAFTLPTYLSDVYKAVFKNDLAIVNAANTWRLPIPARFIIGTDGTIIDAQADPDYRFRPDPEATLALVERFAPAKR